MADLMMEIRCTVCKGAMWKMIVPRRLVGDVQRHPKVNPMCECATCGEQYAAFRTTDLYAPEIKHDRA